MNSPYKIVLLVIATYTSSAFTMQRVMALAYKPAVARHVNQISNAAFTRAFAQRSDKAVPRSVEVKNIISKKTVPVEKPAECKRCEESGTDAFACAVGLGTIIGLVCAVAGR